MNKWESKFGRFTASLHTHVRSQFDAHIEPDRLCEKIKEMGGKGCAITDHGVLSSIEDYKPAFKEAGLKLIPGCELYVDGGVLGRLHLIVLAKSDKGYKGISKIVTEANRNLVVSGSSQYAVIKKEDLFNLMQSYKGEIVCLSACMQGVLSSIFLMNNIVEKKIEDIRKKQEKYLSVNDERYIVAQTKLAEATKNVETLIEKRDICKQKAEEKFSKREKAIEKLASEGSDISSLQAELEKDKKETEAAVKALPEIKAKLEASKKALTKAKNEFQDLKALVEKYDKLEEQIINLARELKTDEEVHSIAKREALLYKEAFGEADFYAEIQYHGIEEEKICYPKVVDIAKELHIPIVATNDVHILTKSNEERLKRCILRSLRFGDEFAEENVGDDELYLKDNYELADSLSQILDDEVIIEGIKNIDVVFDKCNVEFNTGKHYPKFSNTGDANEILDKEVAKGIKWRFPNGIDKVHSDRIEYELSIIKKMGYADYHLIVKDFLEYGRLLGYIPKDKLDEVPLTIEGLKEYIKEHELKNGGMTIGPGRGSAVGSLVCYVLGITDLDPLKYDLLFERFLSPERISMPDIDSDIANTTRAKVIEYVKHKYGEMAVCGIMTTEALAPKGALNMAAKFYGLKKNNTPLTSLGFELSKAVPSDVGVSFSTLITEGGKVSEDKNDKSLKDYLLSKYASNKDAVNIIKWATVLEGAFTAYGAHAAGIVISDNGDVSEYLPLRANQNLGMFTTQCDMVQVEDNGLLKFDFLGLKTLDVITETLRMIEDRTGVIINPKAIDFEDERVYKEILQTGKTLSVFQFKSAGMRSMLKRFKPTCFEDLIILVSMFRPGPLQYLDGVIDVKNGRKPIEYLCKELEPILGKTYGAIVYQEQVMEICQKLAGYTLGGADTVRRYMSKKKADKLAHEREKFIVGCVSNGISKDIADTLFGQMMDFARYAFNKSHAAVYAFNAYITAWLKLYYPAEFFASALNWADNKEIAGLMKEATSFGVKVLPPSINVSSKEFCVSNGEIRFGLSMVKGISNNADDIIEERKNGIYLSVKDFLYRVKPNQTVITNLISAGGLDEFCGNRASMKEYVDSCKEMLSDLTKKEDMLKSMKECLPIVESMSIDEIIKFQQDNGLKVVVNKETTAEKLQKRIENTEKSIKAMERDVDQVHFRKIDENKTERMSLEKKLLGLYVTEHPMDYYPLPQEVGTKQLSDISEDTHKIYGVITELSIKSRKADGANMAFFTLEDKSGSYDCSCFTKSFKKNKDYISEGNVVIVKGNVHVEELDDGEKEYNSFVEEVLPVKEKESSVLMQVSSYATFHLDHEESFIKNFSEENGKRLLIHDKSLNEIREVNYLVSKSVLTLPNVTEVF